MIEKKTATVASLILLVVFGAPIAASAATPYHLSNSAPIYLEDQDDGDQEEDSDSSHDELHEDIPPVFVVPGSSNTEHPVLTKEPITTQTKPLNPSQIGSPATGSKVNKEFLVVSSQDPASKSALERVNPHHAKPIDVSLVRTSLKTPADRFMEAAYIAMAGLGVTAVGLGTVAAVRGIRLRRSGKSDYFYDNN
jgi:hypothetical protein